MFVFQKMTTFDVMKKNPDENIPLITALKDLLG